MSLFIGSCPCGSNYRRILAFFAARYFARSQVENLLEGKFKEIDEGVEKKGWVYVAVTRLIPVFPFNLLNYVFGLTKTRFSHYASTSFICMFHATAANVVLSSSLIDLLKGKVSLELLIGVALLASCFRRPFYL